ncbi:hypothetical protein ACYG9R_06675 [Mesorhizobium sp. RSR565B]|uniref:hypothetical protein n=1 Tax=Mesorhizobium sp. L103C565B0 TaxID=1287094 RepID=UPI0012DF3E2D|nr:hypothetical protein [Mesorhizobium sp. L103C565B0]
MTKSFSVVPGAIVLFLATCVSSASFANSDFLRISVNCPDQSGNGVLEAISENPEGHRSKVSYLFRNGHMERVAVASSLEGTAFKERFALDRATSEATKEAPAFHGYEENSQELLRFYCFAEPAAKQRYLDLLRANQELLRQSRGG